MLTTTIVIGLLLMLLSIAILLAVLFWYALNNPRTKIGEWLYRWWPFGIPASVQERENAHEQRVADELRQATRPVTIMSLIKNPKLGMFLRMIPGGDAVQVTGLLKLLELQHFGPDKANKVHTSPSGESLREFIGLSLNTGHLILQLPVGEGKSLAWFLGEDVTDTPWVAVSEFMQGTAGNPGPAKQFAQSNQSADVQFSLDGIPGNWKCRDIVWADVVAEGEAPLYRDARVAMLLSEDASDPSQWLLFVDLRSGQGSDLLFALRRIDPEIEFEQL